MILRARLACILITLQFVLVPPIHGAGYIKIGDIKGESTAAGYEEWIVMDAVEWVRPCPSHVLSSDPEGVELPAVQVRKRIDKSSPYLMRLNGLALGADSGLNPLPPKLTARYVLLRTYGDGTTLPYLIIDMTDVLVTNYSKSSGTEVAMEELTLSFGAVRQTYLIRGPGGDIVEAESQAYVLREGSSIPPPPDGIPAGSAIDSITIGDAESVTIEEEPAMAADVRPESPAEDGT